MYLSTPELIAMALAVLAAIISVQYIRDVVMDRKLREHREHMREIDRRANYSANVVRSRDLL